VICSRRGWIRVNRRTCVRASFVSLLVIGSVTLLGVGASAGGAVTAVAAQSSSGTSPIWTAWQVGNGNEELSSYLSGVSCVSSDSCTAVGWDSYDGSNTPRTEQWDGSSWVSRSLAVNPSYPGQTLNGVSCTSASFCFAVGSFIALRNGGSWTTSTTDITGTLNGVSCDSSVFCMAVGVTSSSGANQTLVENWDGSTWSVVPSPNQGTNSANSLAGVSCISTTNCVAVGEASNGSVDQTLVEEWDGTTWSIVTSPNTSPTLSNDLAAVSCVSPSACTAVGHSSNGSVDQSLIEQWNGATWSITPSPDTSSEQASDLGGVSCPTSDTCYATGTTGNANDQPLFLAGNGTSWSLQETPNAVQAGQGISCTSATFCAAVGSIAGNIDLWYTPGYWEVLSDGGIFSFGSARFYGSMGGKPLNAPIVGVAATPGGDGYWEVASDGGIFAFGDAGYYGSMADIRLDEPIVGIAATPDGQGYWEVAADGGIFAFGDAGFSGSMGGTTLNAPVVGMAATTNGWYWEVASDGGIFNLGGAPFYGSLGGVVLNQPVVGMARTADGYGYWEVARDGGIFSFGSAQFEGSEGGHPLNAPVVGIASSGVVG